jgi:choline dehydrogenase-like flavoprotein
MVENLVVGSGPAGAMAAQTLVEAGVSVTMLDVGFDVPEKRAEVPNRDFLDIRHHLEDQYRYLIGERAEGVPWGAGDRDNQITPARLHMAHAVDSLAPVVSASFRPFESLGYGGLGIGWGLGCWQFSTSELVAAGLHPHQMTDAYREINRRIGITGAWDDVAPYALDPGDTYLPPPCLDRVHTLLLERYRRRRQELRRSGFSLGRHPLALLTRDLGQRHAHRYHDMEFYADLDHSAWRPWMTIDTLRRGGRLKYREHALVTRFSERDDGIQVNYLDLDSGRHASTGCRRLIIAAGALGSARIVLRSTAAQVTRLPLLCNPYAYIPCLLPQLVGHAPERQRLGLAQLAIVHDRDGDNSDLAIGALYSYLSLMLFRIIRQAPVNFRDAARIMRYLMTGFAIMGLQFPDSPDVGKFVRLERSDSSRTGDQLRAEWREQADVAADRKARRDRFRAFMRKLGAYPLRTIDPGPGSSIHYAGTVPFSEAPLPGRLRPDGRLHGTRAVFVADSAGFRYLPAKGHTWSIMAYAHLTALAALGV